MPGYPGRILIADDEPELLTSLAAALEDTGRVIDTAADGRQALALIRSSQYDLVVTDLKMPGLDGSTFIARMLEHGAAPAVIVITGYATLEAAIDCLRKGAVDFLVKPFDAETFQRSVKQALQRVSIDRREPVREEDAPEAEVDLTPRQEAVLNAFCSTGKTNRELARELCLSVDTVKSHLREAFRKLGVKNRAQLAQALQRRSRTTIVP